MKHNTEKVRALLAQAAREMPQDFALSEARFHLNVAMQKIQQVEEKRVKRAEIERLQSEKHWPVAGTPTANTVNINEALSAIDNMIASEEKKIKEIQERRNKSKTGDNDEFSPILG